MKYVQISRL